MIKKTPHRNQQGTEPEEIKTRRSLHFDAEIIQVNGFRKACKLKYLSLMKDYVVIYTKVKERNRAIYLIPFPN